MEISESILVGIIPGFVNIAAGILIIGIARRAASGRLGRNGFAGTRIKSTMDSDEAWEAGHKAGLRWSNISGWIFIAAGVVCILVAPFLPWIIGVAILAGAVVGLAAMALSVRDANRAAKLI